LRGYKVIKANDLVRQSRYQLSLQEQKIILFLISKITPDSTDFSCINFEITEFCDVCGIGKDGGKSYKNVKDAIKKLADKSLWVRTDSGKNVLLRWINRAWLEEKDGTIQIWLHDDMKPYLLDLHQKFTQYELLYTLAMKSQYSIRLYELLRSYEYQKGLLIDIDEMREMLAVTAYPRYQDFRRNVIEMAIGEINSLSDIVVTYKAIKTNGGKIDKIEFTIRLKKDMDERLQTWNRIDKVLNPKQTPLFAQLQLTEN